MKIWNDPVWSKVIAGVIIAILAAPASYFLNNFTLPSILANWSATSIAVHPTILLAVLIFYLLVGLFVLYVNLFKKYDAFLSAPMSFGDENSFTAFHEFCLEIKALLESECGFKHVYYAGSLIKSSADFNPAQNAAEDDLKALRNSKRFVLIMPGKMCTSSILEAGFALRKGLPSVYFCKTIDDLPFLMRKLNDTRCYVKIYDTCGKDLQGIKNYIKNYKRRIFSRKD